MHIIPSLLDTRMFRQSLGDVAGIPVLSVSKGELSPIQSAVKRSFDFVLSSVLLLVLSPLIGAVALAVKWTSPGPALFRQKRLGLNGEPFTLYKFRTMRADAEQVLKNSPALYAKYVQNNFKLPKGEDPRLTRRRFISASDQPRRVAATIQRVGRRDELGRSASDRAQ